MKIRILGCDGGELPGFSSVSFFINDHLILDAGSITSSLSLKEQHQIKEILITHGHLDHIKDLCFLGENLFLSGSVSPISIYSSEAILTDITKNIFNGIIWMKCHDFPSPKNPLYKLRSIKKTLTLGELSVKAIPARHSHAALSYVISDKKSSVVISGDTGVTELLWEEVNKTKNLRALFIEVSFPSVLTDLAWQSRHLSVPLLVHEIKKIKNKKVPIYLYHLKPVYFKKIQSEIKMLHIDHLKILRSGTILKF